MPINKLIFQSYFSVGGRKLKLGLDHEILVDGEESVIPVHNERFSVHKASSYWSLGKLMIFKIFNYSFHNIVS